MVRKKDRSTETTANEKKSSSRDQKADADIAQALLNLTGTTNLLQTAVDNNVGKFIFASSSSVYGNTPRLPFNEDDNNANAPISP